jgi:hypothetical protein
MFAHKKTFPEIEIYDSPLSSNLSRVTHESEKVIRINLKLPRSNRQIPAHHNHFTSCGSDGNIQARDN